MFCECIWEILGVLDLRVFEMKISNPNGWKRISLNFAPCFNHKFLNDSFFFFKIDFAEAAHIRILCFNKFN